MCICKGVSYSLLFCVFVFGLVVIIVEEFLIIFFASLTGILVCLFSVSKDQNCVLLFISIFFIL
jgi:hypothetical protein